MNSRQKAKLYKRQLEMYGTMPVPTFTIGPNNVDTICVDVMVDPLELYKPISNDFLELLPPCAVIDCVLEDEIKNRLAHKMGDFLATHFDDFMCYDSKYVPELHAYKCSIKMRVLRRPTNE